MVSLLAGCNGTFSSGTTEVSPTGTPVPTTEQPTEATTTTAEQTTDETPSLAVEERYGLGESHTIDEWSIAVTTVSLDTTFQLDSDDTTYRMPEGEQLAVVTVEVTNTEDSRKTWAGVPFAIIADGRLFDEQLGFDHPDFDGPVQMDDLVQIDHVRRYAPSGYPVEGGETVRSWMLFVLPRDLTCERIEIGFDDDLEDDAGYPIRWVPKKC